MPETAQIPDSESRFETLYRDLKRKEKEIGGYKGMIGKLQAELAETKRAPAVDKPAEAENKPAEAAKSEKPEFIRTYEAYCGEHCGGPNPDYKAPNLFCHSDKCKGVIPIAHITEKDVVVNEKTGKKDLPRIKTCWNCGSNEHMKLDGPVGPV